MFWHFFDLPSPADKANNYINTTRLEIIASSLTASCIAALCFFTLFINLWVCFRIYKKRSFRSSCTALIVANVALVDILVSIKDLPFLLSVGVSSKWYFDTDWCRTYGLTNVVYIIVSISTLISIVTDRYITTRQNRNGTEHSHDSNPNNKIILLGYIIAQTTLSYSLSLIWSKYTFLSRKAFCQVEFSSSGFPMSLVVSFLFLIPVATLAFSMMGNTSREKLPAELKNNKFCDKHQRSTVCSGDVDGDEENVIHYHLQVAIGIFLISWSPYVVESFFPSPQTPSVPGIVSAFIPMMTTSLMPFFFVLTHDKPKVKTTYSPSSEVSSYLLAWRIPIHSFRTLISCCSTSIRI